MECFTKKSFVRKIIIACVILLLINFSLVPYASYATDDDDWSIGGNLAKELMQLIAWFGDVVMGALNNFMLGAEGFGTVMLSTTNNPNLEEGSGSWIYVREDEEIDEEFEEGTIDTSSWLPGVKYEIPNMLYSPENIFANNIAALDINFLRPNEYQSIYVSGSSEFEESANKAAISAASGNENGLKNTIANWYKSFRNIAIVGLLSVLIYLGIRILISSTAADKAKYKESLRDWLMALCLVFIIHIIMSGILMLTDKCTELFSNTIDNGITVSVGSGENEEVRFRTNLMGLIRFRAQSKKVFETATYTIIYIALVIYTCIFTFVYFKRFLYMAFFTMIAPLVALTYPIDRAGDGKAQAFNLWFKEYTMNAIIQPVHLIIYTVFVSSAYDLAVNNPLYALVAIGFLIPAEKFIKKMFGLDKAESTGGFGSFAGGALAMSGLKKLAGMGQKGGKGKEGGSGEKAENDNSFSKIPGSGNLSRLNDKDTDDKQKMLDADDEKYNTDEWDPQQRDALANELSRDDGGMKYSDDDYEQMLRDSGYEDEEEIKKLVEENRAGREQPEQEGVPESDQNSQQNANTNTKGKLKNVARATRGLPRKIKNSVAGRVVGRGAKAAGEQLWKNKGRIARGVMKVTGAGIGAGIGLGAALTTGDASKAVQYTMAGALAGNAIGGNIQKGGEKLISGTVSKAKGAVDSFGNVIREERDGYEAARNAQLQKQNEKARKKFLKDDKEIARYKQIAADMKYKGNIKDLMNAAADYKEAGITDDNLIKNSLKAEYKRGSTLQGDTHKQFVDVAAFSHNNGYGKDYIEDDKKRASLEGVISSEIKDPRAQREAAQMFAEIHDRGDMYKKVGTLGRTPQRPATRQNPNP